MRRDWRDALAHHEGKPCRVCVRWPRELAHVIPRESDWRGRRGRGVVRVHPLAVVPLCVTHHRAYDSHQLDLLPHLKQEELQHAFALVGEGEALRRIRGWKMAGIPAYSRVQSRNSLTASSGTSGRPIGSF